MKNTKRSAFPLTGKSPVGKQGKMAPTVGVKPTGSAKKANAMKPAKSYKAANNVTRKGTSGASKTESTRARTIAQARMLHDDGGQQRGSAPKTKAMNGNFGSSDFHAKRVAAGNGAQRRGPSANIGKGLAARVQKYTF